MPYEEDDLDLFQDAEDQEELEEEQAQESDPNVNGYEMEYDDDDQIPSEQMDDDQLDDQDQERDPEREQDVKPEEKEIDDTNEEKQKIIAGTYREQFSVTCDRELLDAETYNLTPTTAFIQGCATYSMAFSWGTKFLFTGGEDGFIRRYSFVESVTGRQPLAMVQRPTFIDTIVNGGVLKGYWENEEPLEEQDYKFDAQGTYAPKLSPVYSLAVHSEALWACAGLESGGITLQTARYSEGSIQAYLKLHTSTVSELALDHDEQFLLSGSWDKTVAYWDLNTGVPIRHYTNLHGQISTIAFQPLGGPLCSSDDNKSMDSLFGDEENEEPEEAKNAEESKANTGNTFMVSTVNGAVEVCDTRTTERGLQMSGSTAPPWCISACWSYDGSHIYAGRRNNTVDEYDVRMSSIPARTLKFPSSSGGVSGLVAMPNGRSLLCSSSDNLRLYDLKAEATRKTPFYIVPSHHGAVISRLLLDPSGRYLLTASGSRGWNEGPTSDMVLSYEVSPEQR